jgi:hypothetical protein
MIPPARFFSEPFQFNDFNTDVISVIISCQGSDDSFSYKIVAFCPRLFWFSEVQIEHLFDNWSVTSKIHARISIIEYLLLLDCSGPRFVESQLFWV